MASPAAPALGSGVQPRRNLRAARGGKRKRKQLADMFAAFNSAVACMNGTLAALSCRVDGIDGRLGQLEGEPAAKRTRTEGVASSAAAAEDAARQALAEMMRAKEAAAAAQAENARLQASATAAEEAAARCQAEKESLRATLLAIRDACQCPILQDFTAEMVVASDGESYDRRAIQQWRQRGSTSPVTREALQSHLFPNRFARRVFEELQKAGLGNAEASAASGSLGSSQDPQAPRASAAENPDAAAPAPGALRDAIRRDDQDAAFQLLQRHPLPGLNDLIRNGRTVLHLALLRRCPNLAMAILARPDFSMINAKGQEADTALHIAAVLGYLPVCQAILSRTDFTELLVVEGSTGKTALQLARFHDHQDVAELLQDAENRLREQ